MDTEALLDEYNLFFPGEKQSTADFDEAVTNGDIIIDPEKIVNLLQSALLDEAILEVQFDELTRVFFCRVLEHLPELEEKEMDGVIVMVEPEYSQASYLAEQDHVILTPLEPSIGNFLICSAKRLILRILSSKCAFEMGCIFDGKVRVRGMPVLKSSFPAVVRQVKGARAYRAKIPKDMELLVTVERRRNLENFATCPIDISVHGMLLVNPFGKYADIKEDEKIRIELCWPKNQHLVLKAKVQHISQLRDKTGIQYCIGIQFDLATRSLARDVEQVVAGVQRRRLRELSDIGDEVGVDFKSW